MISRHSAVCGGPRSRHVCDVFSSAVSSWNSGAILKSKCDFTSVLMDVALADVLSPPRRVGRVRPTAARPLGKAAGCVPAAPSPPRAPCPETSPDLLASPPALDVGVTQGQVLETLPLLLPSPRKCPVCTCPHHHHPEPLPSVTGALGNPPAPYTQLSQTRLPTAPTHHSFGTVVWSPSVRAWWPLSVPLLPAAPHHSAAGTPAPRALPQAPWCPGRSCS